MDFLLRDAYEKKLNIRSHISCLMEDLKDAKNHLTMQEERFVLVKRSRRGSDFFFFLLLEKF
jgi:hypothetical protein